MVRKPARNAEQPRRSARNVRMVGWWNGVENTEHLWAVFAFPTALERGRPGRHRLSENQRKHPADLAALGCGAKSPQSNPAKGAHGPLLPFTRGLLAAVQLLRTGHLQHCAAWLSTSRTAVRDDAVVCSCLTIGRRQPFLPDRRSEFLRRACAGSKVRAQLHRNRLRARCIGAADTD